MSKSKEGKMWITIRTERDCVKGFLSLFSELSGVLPGRIERVSEKIDAIKIDGQLILIRPIDKDAPSQTTSEVVDLGVGSIPPEKMPEVLGLVLLFGSSNTVANVEISIWEDKKVYKIVLPDLMFGWRLVFTLATLA